MNFLKKKIKVCFISKEIYPYLTYTDEKTAGGAERQQFLLANKFKDQELDIFFIVGDYNQKNIEKTDKFTIIKSFYLFQNNHILRLIFDFILLLSAMKKANADIYFNRILHYHTIFTAFLCKIMQKSFIFSVGTYWSSDINEFKKLNPIRRFLYKYGIKNSNILIVQTEFQKQNFKKLYEKDGIVIKNAYPLDSNFPLKSKPPIILWVGSIQERKQP
ncbi:MAG: glycosyltransferase, partial [Promethearchaeota archaeon]